MLLMAITATAQQNNKFYVGEVSGMLSLPVDLPFYVENTSDGIVALQADVIMPEGMTLQTQANKTRSGAHQSAPSAGRVLAGQRHFL